jgi:hypothetical protein
VQGLIVAGASESLNISLTIQAKSFQKHARLETDSYQSPQMVLPSARTFGVERGFWCSLIP